MIASLPMYDVVPLQSTTDAWWATIASALRRRGFADIETMLSNSGFRPQVKGVPFGTQYPKALRDILVANGILNADYTPNEATAARLGWKLESLDDPDLNPELKQHAEGILDALK